MRKRIALVLVSLLVLAAPILLAAESFRTYVARNYMLELDGMQTGFIKSVGGGNVYAEVINEPVGPDYFVRKHIGQPKYEDFTMQIGFGMSKPVYDWIAASWKQQYQRKNGAVVTTDYNNIARSARQFYNALITETTIPAMDGASKEPAYLTVKFAPEYTRLAKPGVRKDAPLPPQEAQKAWIPANFRLEIDGLDATRVNKIDAFTIKQTAVQDEIGDARDQQREPGKLEFPNLKLSLAAVSADSWLAWHDDFVVKGNNGQDREKNGALYLLSTDRQEVLATIKFFNMGIISIREAAADETGLDAILRYEVELYVERMEFVGPGGLK